MKPIDPVEALRQAGGGSPRVEEQAEAHASAYGRIETKPDPATGLPARDAIFSNGGGYSATVTSGRGDDVPYPQDVAAVSGQRSSVDPEPQDFGHRLTPVPEDGFGAAASGVDAIVRGR